MFTSSPCADGAAVTGMDDFLSLLLECAAQTGPEGAADRAVLHEYGAACAETPGCGGTAARRAAPLRAALVRAHCMIKARVWGQR